MTILIKNVVLFSLNISVNMGIVFLADPIYPVLVLNVFLLYQIPQNLLILYLTKILMQEDFCHYQVYHSYNIQT